MNSILADLFKGKIVPYENLTPSDPEFSILQQKTEEEKEYFKSILSADDYARLDSYEETSDILSEMFSTEAFIRGFRLASMIMGEVYRNKDDLADFKKLLDTDSSKK